MKEGFSAVLNVRVRKRQAEDMLFNLDQLGQPQFYSINRSQEPIISKLWILMKQQKTRRAAPSSSSSGGGGDGDDGVSHDQQLLISHNMRADDLSNKPKTRPIVENSEVNRQPRATVVEDSRTQAEQSPATILDDNSVSPLATGNGFGISRVSSEQISQRPGRFLSELRLTRPVSATRPRSASAQSFPTPQTSSSSERIHKRRGSMNSIIATSHSPAVFDVKVFRRFVPAIVERALVQHPLDSHAPPKTEHFDGAVLFADASGFTALTEGLSKQKNGTELLCQTINGFFTKFLSVAEAHGGDVVKFSGDALTVVWGSGEHYPSTPTLPIATQRAARCADVINHQLHNYNATDNILLSFHTGLGAGRLAMIHVGGARSRWEYVCLGAPLEQIAIAEPLARPGETVASPEAWGLIEGVARGSPVLSSNGVHEGFMRLEGVEPDLCPPLVRLTEGVMDFSHIPLLKRYIPAAVHDQLEEGLSPFVAELRDVSILFARVGGVDVVANGGGGVGREGRGGGLGGGGGGERGSGEGLRIEARGGTLGKQLGGGGGKPDWGGVTERKALTWSGVGTAPAVTCQSALVAAQGSLYRYEGSLNKFMVDDKGLVLLGVFGLHPLSHPDDAQRAIGCSLRMVRVFARLGLSIRIGVVTGDAFCGVVGSPSRHEFTVMGDRVNLAARLMAATPPNSVMCCEATRRGDGGDGGGGAHAFQSLPPIRVKGKCDPIPVFHPHEGKVPSFIDSAMEGGGRAAEAHLSEIVPKLSPHSKRRVSKTEDPQRDDQVQLLRRLGRLQHQGGGVLFITGRQGSGKGALLSYFLKALEESARERRSFYGSSVYNGAGGVPEAWVGVLQGLLEWKGLDEEILNRRASNKPEGGGGGTGTGTGIHPEAGSNGGSSSSSSSSSRRVQVEADIYKHSSVRIHPDPAPGPPNPSPSPPANHTPLNPGPDPTPDVSESDRLHHMLPPDLLEFAPLLNDLAPATLGLLPTTPACLSLKTQPTHALHMQAQLLWELLACVGRVEKKPVVVVIYLQRGTHKSEYAGDRASWVVSDLVSELIMTRKGQGGGGGEGGVKYPVTLVVTSRSCVPTRRTPEYNSLLARAGECGGRLTLRALSPSRRRAHLEKCLGLGGTTQEDHHQNMPPALVKFVSDCAAGYPKHIYYVVNKLKEDGVLRVEGGRCELDEEKLADFEPPSKLVKNLMSTFDELSQLEAVVLKVVAFRYALDWFSMERVEIYFPERQKDVRECLVDLESADFLEYRHSSREEEAGAWPTSESSSRQSANNQRRSKRDDEIDPSRGSFRLASLTLQRQLLSVLPGEQRQEVLDFERELEEEVSSGGVSSRVLVAKNEGGVEDASGEAGGVREEDTSPAHVEPMQMVPSPPKTRKDVYPLIPAPRRPRRLKPISRSGEPVREVAAKFPFLSASAS